MKPTSVSSGPRALRGTATSRRASSGTTTWSPTSLGHFAASQGWRRDPRLRYLLRLRQTAARPTAVRRHRAAPLPNPPRPRRRVGAAGDSGGRNEAMTPDRALRVLAGRSRYHEQEKKP